MTSFAEGWRKQRFGVVCWEERSFYFFFYQALERSLLMSGFQGYGRFYSHIHMFQGLSKLLNPTLWNACRSRQAGHQGQWLSAWPDFKVPGKTLPPPSPHPPTVYPYQQGLIHKEGKMDILPTMSQAVFLSPLNRWGNWGWKIINELPSWPGNWLCLWVYQSLLFGKKLVNSFLMRCEFHDSWVHAFHKWKALTMHRSPASC